MSLISSLWRPEHFDTAFLFLQSKQEINIFIKNERAQFSYEIEANGAMKRYQLLEATLSFDGTVTFHKPATRDGTRRNTLIGYTKVGKNTDSTLFFNSQHGILAKVKRSIDVTPRAQKNVSLTSPLAQYEYYDSKGARFMVRQDISASKFSYLSPGASGKRLEVGQQEVLDLGGAIQKRVLRYYALQSGRTLQRRGSEQLASPKSSSPRNLDRVGELLRQHNTSTLGHSASLTFSPQTTVSSPTSPVSTRPINLSMIRSLSETQLLRSIESQSKSQKTLDLFTNLVLDDDEGPSSAPSSSTPPKQYYPIENHWVTTKRSVMDKFTFGSLLKKAANCELHERRAVHIASNLRYCVLSSRQLFEILCRFPSLDDSLRVKIVSSARLADDKYWKKILYTVKDVRLREEASRRCEFVSE